MSLINSLIQFVSGTKAVASEINQNYETLRTAHNDQEAVLNGHETVLDDHESRVGTLETTTTSLGNNKLDKSGGTMSGAINMGSQKITSLANGTNTADAVNKAQLDTAISGINLLVVPKRQTVLSGRVDSNGYANFAEAGTGLQAIIKASESDPLVLSFSNGFNENGAVDYFVRVTSDQTASLYANSTNYIIADYYSDGTVSFSYTSYPCLYSYCEPSSPINYQCWYDLSESRMKQYRGSSWYYDFYHAGGNAIVRLFLGEAVTNSTNVTSVKTYALNGLYESPETTYIEDVTVVFDHNIGTDKVSKYYKLLKNSDKQEVSSLYIDSVYGTWLNNTTRNNVSFRYSGATSSITRIQSDGTTLTQANANIVKVFCERSF